MLQALLIAVLILVLLQFLLDAVGLEPKARQIIWVIAVVIVVLYVVTGRALL